MGKKAICGGCFSGLFKRSNSAKPVDNSGWLDPASDAYEEIAKNEEPLRVTVVGAAGQIGYSLLPMIANGEMFGKGQRVILQCLDLNLPQVTEMMRGVEMELWDGDFPLLEEVFFTVDDNKAFASADYVILLGAYPQMDGKERLELLDKNISIYRTMGNAIELYAKRDCKVLTVAHPTCANALMCAHCTPNRPKENFFGLTRLEQNRVVGQLAQKTSSSSSEIRNVAIWGLGCSSKKPDLENCTVKGRTLQYILGKDEEKSWLEQEMPAEVKNRGTNIYKARKGVCALSAARAIVGHMRDLHCGTRPGTFTSMGVWTTGNEYGISDGLIFSMPITCLGRGQWKFSGGLTVCKESRERIKEAERELLAERDNFKEAARKHGFYMGADTRSSGELSQAAAATAA
mmetsp:Transcript_74086/g.162136  ORF Transcript_74086/g.162136 Transcript_74086/m.162136 type:complete len:402 (+) Transcript_74086:79-1284(+)